MGESHASDLRDAALRAGVFQCIIKRAKVLLDEARDELRAIPFGDTLAGLVDDEILCKVSWTKGRKSAEVTDERALLAWVRENRPDELIEAVNPAWLKTLKDVDGVVIDRLGEPVPGVACGRGEPFVTVKTNGDTPALVAQLLSGGRVSLDGIAPELAVK